MIRKNNDKKPGAACPLTLSEAPLSVPLRVTGVESGRQAQSRLASMGIIPGEMLRVLRRDNGGPLLIDVKGTRVALGRGISSKVTVISDNKSVDE